MERKVPHLERRDITLTTLCLDPLLRVVMGRHFRRLATVFVTYPCFVWSGRIRVLGPPELGPGR